MPKKTPTQDRYPQRIRDKVAIVGFAPHKTQAPYGDPEFEIWGLNRLHVVQQGNWARWFEIHDLGLYDFEGEDAPHLAFLQAFPGPVYLRPQDVGKYDIPNGQPLPLPALLEDFHPYFNNSIAYEVAMAIGMGFKEIHLYGVDMAQDTLLQAEYSQQRPSCEFFLGIAVGRGIRLVLPKGADLLVTSHLYGIDEIDPIRGKKEARFQELGGRKNEAKQRIAQLNAEAAQLTGHVQALDGAMQEIEYELRNLSPQHDHSVCVNGKLTPIVEETEEGKAAALKGIWK